VFADRGISAAVPVLELVGARAARRSTEVQKRQAASRYSHCSTPACSAPTPCGQARQALPDLHPRTSRGCRQEEGSLIRGWEWETVAGSHLQAFRIASACSHFELACHAAVVAGLDPGKVIGKPADQMGRHLGSIHRDGDASVEAGGFRSPSSLGRSPGRVHPQLVGSSII